jgi:hypothetical protein
MSRVLLMLVLIMAIGWDWARHAHAYSVTAGLEDRGKPMYVLVVDNSAGEEGMQAETRSDLVLAQAGTQKFKTKAPRKASSKAPTETEISAETRRRLYELRLLDALRSAGQR